MKLIVKCWKDFLWYFIKLETYRFKNPKLLHDFWSAPDSSHSVLDHCQRENTLRYSLQKFITLHKATSVYLWGWCRMLVEIELLPRGWPNGVPSMPKNLKKVQIYPNLVITLLEVNSLTLHNLHYIVLALCKAARPAQIKENIEILVLWWGSSSPISLGKSFRVCTQSG